jgi:hypothetical protein
MFIHAVEDQVFCEFTEDLSNKVHQHTISGVVNDPTSSTGANAASSEGADDDNDIHGSEQDAECLEYFILGANVRKGVGAIASLKIPGIKQERFLLASETLFNHLTVDFKTASRAGLPVGEVNSRQKCGGLLYACSEINDIGQCIRESVMNRHLSNPSALLLSGPDGYYNLYFSVYTDAVSEKLGDLVKNALQLCTLPVHEPKFTVDEVNLCSKHFADRFVAFQVNSIVGELQRNVLSKHNNVSDPTRTLAFRNKTVVDSLLVRHHKK